nr:sensor domain-containing diguanylate cyclase [Marinitoga lauensis]
MSSLKEFKKFFYNNPSIALLIDNKQNKIIDANKATIDFLGYSHEKLLNTSPDKIFNFSYENIDKNTSLITSAKLSNDEIKIVEMLISVIPDNKNNFLLSIIHDITEKKDLENKILEEEKMYKLIFENAPIGIFYYNKDGYLTNFNHGFLKVFGTYEEQYKKFNLFEIPYKEIVEKLKNVFKGKKECIETKYTALLSKKTLYIRAFFSPVYDANNNIIAGMGIVEDFTEKKHFEENLALEKEKFKKYFEVSQVLNIILDKKGKIFEINNKASNLLKINKEKAIGIDWFENFIPKDVRKNTKNVFLKIMNGLINSVEYYENEIINTKGEKFIISWHNSYIKDSTGKIQYIISSGIDITKEKKYIEELKNNEKFANTLLEISKIIMRNDFNSKMAKHILKKIIDITPAAEKGSFLIKEGNKYKFYATVGYDLKHLKSVYFDANEAEKLFKSCSVIKKWEKNSAKNIYNLENLNKYGYRNEIKTSILIPITINNEYYGYITLDNLENENAFDKKCLKFVDVLKNYLDLLLEKNYLEKRLKDLSIYDSLTNIYNRYYFYEKLEEFFDFAKRYNRIFSIIYLDINDFKKINDTYGHLVGDKVLIKFSRLIKENLRKTDIFARLGEMNLQ